MNSLPQLIRERLDWVASEHLDEGHYVPHATVRSDVDHLSYIKYLLSPSHNHNLLEQTAQTLLCTTPGQHAKELDCLRFTEPVFYGQLIRGKIGSALRRARTINASTFEMLVSPAITHNCLFMLKTAYRKLEAVRDLSKQPYGMHFSGRNRWLMMGSTFLETVAAPALVIQKLIKLEKSDVTVDLDDEQVFQFLVKELILPDTKAGRFVFEAGQIGRDLMVRGPRKRGALNFKAANRIIKAATLAASRINRGDMKKDGLANLTFAEDRLGFSASVAAAYLAVELIEGFTHLDACIDAIRCDNALPTRSAERPSLRSAGFVSSILRAEVQSDRNAPKVGNKVGLDVGPLEEYRGSGRIPVRQLYELQKDSDILVRAASELSIDASFWLRR